MLDPNTQMDVNDEIKLKVLHSLDAIGGELSSLYSHGKEFVAEQAPQLAKEIIYWGIAESALYAMFAALIIVFLVWAKSHMYKEYEKSDRQSDKEFMGGCIFFTWIFIIIASVFVMVNLHSMVKPIVAPRLYIIDQAAEMVKGQTQNRTR